MIFLVPFVFMFTYYKYTAVMFIQSVNGLQRHILRFSVFRKILVKVSLGSIQSEHKAQQNLKYRNINRVPHHQPQHKCYES